MYKILIVGAGYLGSAVARDFKARKQRVFALTRNAAKAAEFEKEGIQPVVADLTIPETLQSLPAAQFIVISAAPDQSSVEDYRKIYIEGVGNFLNAYRNNPRPYLIVFVSSTSVWKDRAGGWVDESVEADAETEKAKILIAAERQVLTSGYPAIIFRLSGIYGPGRNRLEAFTQGQWPKEGEPDGYMNMIHVVDAARAILPLFKKSKEGAIYVGTDDEPVLRSVFFDWLSKQTGTNSSAYFHSARVEGKRCRNQSLKLLEFEFKYPSFREAYTEFINEREIK